MKITAELSIKDNKYCTDCLLAKYDLEQSNNLYCYRYEKDIASNINQTTGELEFLRPQTCFEDNQNDQ